MRDFGAMRGAPWTVGDILRRMLLSWLTAVLVQYLSLRAELRGLEGLEGLAAQSVLLLLGMAAFLFVLLSLLARRFETLRLERWAIFVVFGILMITSLRASFAPRYLLACLMVLGVLGVYAWRGWCGTEKAVRQAGDRGRGGRIWTAVFATALFIFVSFWTVYRVLTYRAPTFDFGIFSQMFHQMRTTGLPVTTVERDGPLSHFAVHVSPIYYLLLPFYCIYPKPVTLQVLQAAVLASAVIPLWRLCRRHGFSAGVSAGVCLLLLLYPAYSGGTSYDIHENVFLTPLILWMFDGIDREKRWEALLCGGLTLLVKEDAAVYVAVVALWLILRAWLRGCNRWGLVTGGVLLAGALAWFLLVTAYLSRYGDGVMTNRYQNFMYGGSGSLFSVILAVLLSPMKVIYECVDREKLSFLVLTMLPLLGMPLWTRKYERYILLIPYVLVNLMSDYPYQHSVFFQYTYGSIACLIYMTVVNLEDIMASWEPNRALFRYIPLGLAIAISGSCFASVVVPKATGYFDLYQNNREEYIQIGEFLSQIPEDATVTATTFYTVPLSQRAVLYDVRYCSREHLLSTEYVVLDVNHTSSYTLYEENGEDGYQNLVKFLEKNGYTKLDAWEDRLEIYQKK